MTHVRDYGGIRCCFDSIHFVYVDISPVIFFNICINIVTKVFPVLVTVNLYRISRWTLRFSKYYLRKMSLFGRVVESVSLPVLSIGDWQFEAILFQPVNTLCSVRHQLTKTFGNYLNSSKMSFASDYFYIC